MPSHDAELIHRLIQEIGHYLDHQQRLRLLWIDVEGHITASYIAKALQEPTLVRLHLQAVARLMAEIHVEHPSAPLLPQRRPPRFRTGRQRIPVSRMLS